MNLPEKVFIGMLGIAALATILYLVDRAIVKKKEDNG